MDVHRLHHIGPDPCLKAQFHRRIDDSAHITTQERILFNQIPESHQLLATVQTRIELHLLVQHKEASLDIRIDAESWGEFHQIGFHSQMQAVKLLLHLEVRIELEMQTVQMIQGQVSGSVIQIALEIGILDTKAHPYPLGVALVAPPALPVAQLVVQPDVMLPSIKMIKEVMIVQVAAVGELAEAGGRRGDTHMHPDGVVSLTGGIRQR